MRKTGLWLAALLTVSLTACTLPQEAATAEAQTEAAEEAAPAEETEEAAPTPAPDMEIPEGYHLVWADEFDGDSLNEA
ncbi:MAG: hypothetical protein K5649_09925, partial [Lachnospiraceae bacterium]|nr:hypothetical protein [Lachnospiraceae bacterium]